MGSVLGLCVWLRRLSRWRAQVLYALYCVSCAHLLSQLDTHMYPLSTTQVLVFYRLPILCTVMAWLWAGNILFCSRWGVSVHALFRMRSAAAAGHHHDRDGDAAAALTVVHIAVVFTAATAAALALRVWGTELVDGTPRPYYQAALHPFGVHALLLGLLFCPMRVLCPDGRWAVCRALIRTVTAPAREVTFADIIFADCLTSMARGLSALEVVFCLSAAPQTEPTYGSHVMTLSPHCSKANVFPLVLEFVAELLSAPSGPGLLAGMMAAPYWWRLQQCLRRYGQTADAFPHLANALKYCTAFPLIIVDRFGPSMIAQGMSPAVQQRLWFSCALLNFCAVNMWDVTMDWGLAPEVGVSVTIATAIGLHLGHGSSGLGLYWGASGGILAGALIAAWTSNKVCRCSGGRARAETELARSSDYLRDKTAFPPWFYFACLGANLICRMQWVMRLLSLPAWFPQPAVIALALELSEICRRHAWINIRLDWEKICVEDGD